MHADSMQQQWSLKMGESLLVHYMYLYLKALKAINPSKYYIYCFQYSITITDIKCALTLSSVNELKSLNTKTAYLNISPLFYCLICR